MLCVPVQPKEQMCLATSDMVFSLCKKITEGVVFDPVDFISQLEAPFDFWSFSQRGNGVRPLSAPFRLASVPITESGWTFLHIRLTRRHFNDPVLQHWLLQSPCSQKQCSNTLAYRQTPLLRHLISGICTLMRSDETLPAALLELKVQELFLLLYQGFGNWMVTPVTLKEQEKTSLMNLVDASIKGHLKIRQLAKRNHQSLSSFKRYFMHHFNMTPGRYIRKQKLELAYQDLRNGKASIECYRTYGYESVSNFSQAFKRAFGTTPKHFQCSFGKQLPI